MGFFDIFRRKKNVELRDDQEQIEILEGKIRKNRLFYLKKRLKRLKEKQEEQLLEDEISDVEEDLYGDEEDDEGINNVSNSGQSGLVNSESPEMLLLSLFGNIFKAKTQNNQTQNTPQIQGEVLKSLTDEELREYKKKIPAANLAIAKNMHEADLIPMVSEQLAGCDDATIARAIKILKE